MQETPNIDWAHVVYALPNQPDYNLMNVDQRYLFLKKKIEEQNLPLREYQSAVNSLCDFLNY